MTIYRIERVLTYMAASMIGVALLSIIAVFVARAAGADLASGLWPAVAMLPIVALPLGFVVTVAFIVISARRRSRESRDAAN